MHCCRGPTTTLQRTAGLRLSRFVGQWPAAAEFCRWPLNGMAAGF
jgi:hypothetical protein